MKRNNAGPPRFSVVVCSWQRPKWLKRCLLSLRQVEYTPFEIVVVADRPALQQIDGEDLKRVPFDTPNLSMARNAGIEASGGDICAFIDDDSVAEPMWLAHMARGLTETGAVAATGYVRGRNGISFQSRFVSVDREAETHTEPEFAGPYTVPTLAPTRAVKLVGTNMAVTRPILERLGGFDPVYRYFLEDTDLSIRVSELGAPVCVVPDAEVHHAFAASARRTVLRTPITLHDIGRSTALFLRRHNPDQIEEIYTRVVERERLRLLRHMVLGTCEPTDLAKLLKTLQEGWQAGLSSPLSGANEVEKGKKFHELNAFPAGHRIHRSSLLLNRRKALVRATALAKTGQRVSLFSFSLTPFRHHMKYTDEGVWLQTGGLFGRSIRQQPVVRWCRFAERQKEESARVAIARGLRD